jgi:hypothetical protein
VRLEVVDPMTGSATSPEPITTNAVIIEALRDEDGYHE